MYCFKGVFYFTPSPPKLLGHLLSYLLVIFSLIIYCLSHICEWNELPGRLPLLKYHPAYHDVLFPNVKHFPLSKYKHYLLGIELGRRGCKFLPMCPSHTCTSLPSCSLGMMLMEATYSMYGKTCLNAN